MADEYDLTDDQVEDSLAEQGFNPVWDSERWNEVLENEFKDEVADDEVVDADSADGYINVGGAQIPESEAERVARFWEWMNTNPDQAMNFASYIAGDYDLVPHGTAPAAAYEPSGHYDPSQDIDTEDWDLLPESVQTQLKKVTQLEQTLNYQQNAIAHQQQLESERNHSQSMSNVEVAKQYFAQQYDLSEDAVADVVSTAARLNVVPALMSETGDPVTSVYRALEISYLQSTQGRDREFARRLQATDTGQARKRKMSAVGGTGGNVPRTAENLPNTKEGRRDAMVNEIAAAIRGG